MKLYLNILLLRLRNEDGFDYGQCNFGKSFILKYVYSPNFSMNLDNFILFWDRFDTAVYIGLNMFYI